MALDGLVCRFKLSPARRILTGEVQRADTTDCHLVVALEVCPASAPVPNAGMEFAPLVRIGEVAIDDVAEEFIDWDDHLACITDGTRCIEIYRQQQVAIHRELDNGKFPRHWSPQPLVAVRL